MTLSVYSIILPSSLYCYIFGLSTVDFSHTAIGKLQNAYCLAVTLFQFLVCAVSLISRVCNIQVTYASVMYLLSDVATVGTLTYYRVKFIAAKSVITNRFREQDCVDKWLNSSGIKIHHRRDYIACSMYLIVSVTNNVVYAYSF